MRVLRCLPVLLLFTLASACGDYQSPFLPTPLAEDYLPTAIALTVEAGVTPLPPAETPPPPDTEGMETGETPVQGDPTATPSPTLRPTLPEATPAPVTPAITPTPTPDFPEDAIEIYNPGELSKIISPFHLYAYMRPRAGRLARIELFGEDGRLLVRQIKEYEFDSGAWANLSLDIDFEISATAEMGRLVISVEDEYGRLVAVNSVDLVLLSLGTADLNPSDSVLERILIQDPRPKALIQGQQVQVSGLARREDGTQLIGQLIDEEGKVIGLRVFGVSRTEQDPYGTFSAEIPYEVDDLTAVRLVVFESGEPVSPVRYLSSVEILLSP